MKLCLFFTLLSIACLVGSMVLYDCSAIARGPVEIGIFSAAHIGALALAAGFFWWALVCFWHALIDNRDKK